MAEAARSQSNLNESPPDPLERLRDCVVTLFSIRNALATAEPVDQLPAKELQGMLDKLRELLKELKKFSETEDMRPFLLLKEFLIKKVIPDAAPHLNVGIRERSEYENYQDKLDEDSQEFARLKLTNCIKSCNRCSQVLEDMLSLPEYSETLKRLGLDKYDIDL